jgi:hypothetical protein
MTDTEIAPEADASDQECSLAPRVQMSNLVYFAMCTGM